MICQHFSPNPAKLQPPSMIPSNLPCSPAGDNLSVWYPALFQSQLPFNDDLYKSFLFTASMHSAHSCRKIMIENLMSFLSLIPKTCLVHDWILTIVLKIILIPKSIQGHSSQLAKTIMFYSYMYYLIGMKLFSSEYFFLHFSLRATRLYDPLCLSVCWSACLKFWQL